MIIFVLFWAPSCMQTYNSNTGDEGLTGNCAPASKPNFKAAYTVIKKNCINCHTGYHNSYALNCTEKQWTDQGLVTAGDNMSSSIITILKNFSGAGTMPKSSPALSDDDYTALKDWIDGITP